MSHKHFLFFSGPLYDASQILAKDSDELTDWDCGFFPACRAIFPRIISVLFSLLLTNFVGMI